VALPEAGRTDYYVCTIGNHCERGMKIAITGAPPIAPAAGTIVDVASADPELSTVVAAIKAAGLVDALSAAGPFTAFLPEDKAFAEAPLGFVDTILKPENKDFLATVLLHHVAEGKVLSASLEEGMEIPVLAQDPLTVGLAPVTIDDVPVVEADVEASNGVIHKMEALLTFPACFLFDGAAVVGVALPAADGSCPDSVGDDAGGPDGSEGPGDPEESDGAARAGLGLAAVALAAALL